MKTRGNSTDGDVKRLQDYQIERKVGEGMLGKVYKAFDVRSENHIALKVLRTESVDHASRLQGEFRLLSTLRHPHLADVYDYGVTDEGRPYYAMQWINGQPVSKDHFLSESGEFHSHRFAEFVKQITSALTYLRSRNISHGDIKPENILVEITKKGELRSFLMDFGISRSFTSQGDGLSGTFEYMAPEIIRGGTASSGTDLYSFGCVLYEIIAGQPPFTGDTPLEILKRHLQVEPAPLPKDSTLDHELLGWVSTSMAKDTRLRYRIPEQLYAHACEYLKSEPDIDVNIDDAFTVELLHVPRENELAKLKELTEAGKNTFQLAVIEGSHGVGKSRLLSDFRVTLQLEGRIVNTISSETDGRVFTPILKYLATKSNSWDGNEQIPIIASFFPEYFPGIAPSKLGGMDADGEIMRLFHASASALAAITGDVLLIDSLEKLDDLSLEFIAYFISYLAAQATPVVICASVTPDVVNRDLFTADTQQLGTTITLPPLAKDVVKHNIDTLFGGELSQSFHAFVWNQSRGNPASIEEILRYCIDVGVLERTRTGWIVHERDDLAQALPTSVIEKTNHRIGQLGENSLQVLKTLAVSSAPVAPPVLEFVARKSIDRIHELGIILLKYDLMDLVDGRYKPSTKTVQTLLTYEENELQSLHARYVECYKKYPEYAPPLGQLAEHYLGAGASGVAAAMFIEASNEAERIYDYTLTREYLTRALEIPEAIGQDESRFALFHRMVRMCNILGDRDKEAEYIEDLLILAGRWTGKKGADRLAQAYELQTEYHLALGDFEKATRSAERALKNYETAGNKLGTAHSYQKLGFILYRTKPTKEILDLYTKAKDIFSQLDDVLSEANLLIDTGLVYYSILNEPSKALDCYEEAKDKFLSVGMERGAARAFGNAGVQHFALGDYEASLDMHRNANEIFRRIGDYAATGLSHKHIGKCLTAMGRYVEAISEIETSLRISKTVSDVYSQEGCCEDLGDTYHYLGDNDTALKYFNEAKAIAKESGYILGEITNALDIAEIAIEHQQIDEALSSILSASEALQQIQNMHVYAGSLFRLSQAYMAKGERQDFEKALNYQSDLLKIAEANDFEDYQILAYSYSGLAYAHLGRLQEALQQSVNAIDVLGDRRYFIGGKQDILLNHARIFRANKNGDEAEDYIQKAYDEVMRIASGLEDPSYYRSFTESVAINAEVIREYSLLHRTESPQAQSVSRDQNLKTLYDVSRKINSVLDLDQLLENIMDSALEAMNGERGLIFLLENNDLVLKASRNVEKETIRDATEISLSILKDVVSGGQPIIIADTSSDSSSASRASVVNYNIQSIICVPMKSKEQIIGTVYVDTRADALSAMSFSEIDADFLVAFANLATIAIENARLHTKLQQENIYLKSEVSRQFGFENIIGTSKPMDHLFREMQGAIASDNTVLIYGESGTGKELIARAIHYNGVRKEKRFVAIDCGAFQDTLLESELFGYKRGAFTGAVADKRGLFEEAHKGTLFLDEIGNTSLAFQAKLLRVLQSGEFRRVGDTDSRKVDVRVIAATNTQLLKQIEDGVFRQDLYYRLNVIPLNVPELRERRDDIPLLVQHFIAEFNNAHNTSFEGASKELIELLQKHSWPGNVRELENLISRMLVQTDAPVLGLRNLPSDFDTNSTHKSVGDYKTKIPMHLKTLKEIEQEHILAVLNHTGNNKTEAAKILGLKRTTLVERMKKLGLM